MRRAPQDAHPQQFGEPQTLRWCIIRQTLGAYQFEKEVGALTESRRAGSSSLHRGAAIAIAVCEHERAPVPDSEVQSLVWLLVIIPGLLVRVREWEIGMILGYRGPRLREGLTQSRETVEAEVSLGPHLGEVRQSLSVRCSASC